MLGAGGYFVHDAVRELESVESRLKRLQISFNAFKKCQNELVALEYQYVQCFETHELNLSKTTRKLTFYASASEPLLPDLNLKEKIKQQESQLQVLRQRFIDAIEEERAALQKNPHFMKLIEDYNSFHSRQEPAQTAKKTSVI